MDEKDASPLSERKLSQWLYFVERCLADRYRGTYPIGDALVPRLGSYQASHHAFLRAADVLAQAACDVAIEEINHQEQQRIPDAVPMANVALCCHIGNSPSPNALSLIDPMRCGFIELPAAMIFEMGNLASLLHEVGHVVANAFFQSRRDRVQFDDPGIEKEFAEILAECFSLSLCFGGNCELHSRCMEKILGSYLPDTSAPFAQSTAFVYQIRLVAVSWLMEGKWTPSSLTVHKEFFSHIWGRVRGDIPSEDEMRAEATIKKIAEALKRLTRLYETMPEFESYIKGLRALNEDAQVEKRTGGQRVTKFRKFIADKATTVGPNALADDFRMLEEIGAEPA